MRHCCATARPIKTMVETDEFDVFQVQKWLGHETSATTNTYISQAISYYSILPLDWVSLALKPSQKTHKMAGQRDKKKTNRTHFSGLLPEFSPREVHGPVAICTNPTGENLGDRMLFLRLLIFKAWKSISLKPFFFSFFVIVFSVKIHFNSPIASLKRGTASFIVAVLFNHV